MCQRTDALPQQLEAWGQTRTMSDRGQVTIPPMDVLPSVRPAWNEDARQQSACGFRRGLLWRSQPLLVHQLMRSSWDASVQPPHSRAAIAEAIAVLGGSSNKTVGILSLSMQAQGCLVCSRRPFLVSRDISANLSQQELWAMDSRCRRVRRRLQGGRRTHLF